MDYEAMTKEELIRLLVEKENTIRKLESDIFNKDTLYNVSVKLVNLLPEAIVVYKDTQVVLANEVAERMFGPKLLGKRLGEVIKFLPESRSRIDKQSQKLLEKEGEQGFLEHKIMMRDGNIKECEVGGFSFLSGEEMFLVAVLRDISEHRKVERLQTEIKRKTEQLDEVEEYSKLKSSLFATVSHELRTPLNIILGAVELLGRHCTKSCSESNSIRKHVKSIRHNSYRLLKLINNFIDMNKIEAGFLTLKPDMENIVEVIEETTLSVVDYARAKGIRVLFDTDIEEKVFMFDPDKIERVMLNLLSNAIKYTDSGGQINVNIYDRGSSMSISVKDTGIGIPEDMKDRIFDTFTRVDSDYTRRAEGSGIGLALAKSIIELHEGTIRVESQLGEGSEFIIDLPVKLSERDYKDEAVKTYKKTRGERLFVELSDIFTE